MSSLQKNLLKSKLPPMIPRAGKNHPGRQKDYTPSMWSEYFHDFSDVCVDSGDIFRVYRTKPSDTENSPVLILLHGGGFSGLSWALFSTELTSIINCQCLAIDFRGHGDTKTSDDYDLSAETMAKDIASILEKMFEGKPSPNVLIVGHSMGGAIAVHIADLKLLHNLLGIIVIDVVEGTALESLQSMQSFLRSRPTHFKSIHNAIEWCVRSGQIRNVESAKISMPGQIINTETNKLAASELPLSLENSESSNMVSPMSIPESDEDENEEMPAPPKVQASLSSSQNRKKYTWRIDLSRTETFWKGWFENLSNKFLQAPVPKLLILAGIDNLDKALQIGQMQGKFQLQVLARTGHAVHEDQPHQVAEVIGSYLIRNKFATSRSDDYVRVMPEC